MMGNKINQISPVNQINQITNAGALKLQSASLQLQKTADTTSGVQFADLLQQEAQKAQSVQFSKHAALLHSPRRMLREIGRAHV